MSEQMYNRPKLVKDVALYAMKRLHARSLGTMWADETCLAPVLYH